jgi:hypothetical protein
VMHPPAPPQEKEKTEEEKAQPHVDIYDLPILKRPPK